MSVRRGVAGVVGLCMIATGCSGGNDGVGGTTGNSSGTYFGQCPPGPDHHYVFTVYALDAMLGLEANFGIGGLSSALSAHTLAEASITGLASKTP